MSDPGALTERIERDYQRLIPDPNTLAYDHYEVIRRRARNFIKEVARSVPESRELSLAMTHMEQVVMYSALGLARHGIVQ